MIYFFYYENERGRFMSSYLIDGKSALDYAQMSCSTMMKKFDAVDLPPKGRFHYHQGVFLSGMQKTYEMCHEKKYMAYIKQWVDSIINLYGDITSFNPGQLDDLQPGILLFPLLKETGDERYKIAIDTIAYYMETFPTTQEGGFWHKAWYRGQMWLDGLYMAGPFCAQYGMEHGKDSFFDSIAFQGKEMCLRTRDEKTGLWYHAWDSNKKQPWADKHTGRSPEFWGRAIGWVAVAFLDDTDFIPNSHPAFLEVKKMACELIEAIISFQDDASGMWYQVVDKGGKEGNWLETSCTCLYVAAICKAVRKGFIDTKYLNAARKGYTGVINRLKYDGEDVLIDNVCIGTGVGDYAHYCARPTSTNDLHGVGAYLLMCVEAEQVL